MRKVLLVNYEFPIPTLQTLAQCTCSPHTTWNVWCYQSVGNSRRVRRFYQCQTSREQSPAPRQTRLPPRG